MYGFVFSAHVLLWSAPTYASQWKLRGLRANARLSALLYWLWLYQGRSTPYLRPVTIFALFWRRFGVEHVVVYVRVASLFAQAELKQPQ